MAKNQASSSGDWIPASPVVPFVPNSGPKPEWAYFPNGPPSHPPKNTPGPPPLTPVPVANASPDVFFIRDTVASPVQAGQAQIVCWTIGPPPPGWVPPHFPPAHRLPPPPPPPPPPSPDTAASSSTSPAFNGSWTFIPQPISGWNLPPPPPSAPASTAARTPPAPPAPPVSPQTYPDQHKYYYFFSQAP